MNNYLAYIGLGANLGAAQSTIAAAVKELKNTPEITHLKLSSLYDTSPVGCEGPDYINAVVEIKTSLKAIELLTLLQEIELRHGRTRPFRNAPRTLDLDLLWFDNQIIATDRLVVPHPRMHERAFVLQPLIELAPDLVLTQGSLAELLAACQDQRISKISQ